MARHYGYDLYIFGPTGYKCKDCGFEFNYPVNRGSGAYPEEEWYECPHCGSMNYEPVEFNDVPDRDDE